MRSLGRCSSEVSAITMMEAQKFKKKKIVHLIGVFNPGRLSPLRSSLGNQGLHNVIIYLKNRVIASSIRNSAFSMSCS